MRGKRAKRLVTFVAMLTLLAVAGLAAVKLWPGNGQGQATVDAARTVKVGYLPIMGGGGLPLFTAVDRGFFEREGLKVEMVRMESSPALATAAVRGDIDVVGSFAYASALTTESRDPGVVKVFMIDECTPTENLSAMVALPKSGIKRVEDLRGKRVGSFPGPNAMTFFGLVMQKHGLDPKKDVTVVELPAGLHLQALASGQVDALDTYEPMATEAVLDLGAVKYFRGAIETDVVQPWQAGVCALPKKLLDERPEVAKKVIRAMYAALDYTRQHPDEAKKSLPKFTAIEQRVAAVVPVMGVKKLDEFDRVAFQRHADILTETKLLDRKLDATKLLIDPSFLPVGNAAPAVAATSKYSN